MMSNKRYELQQLINEEHGIEFHKNIYLNGYTVYKGKSFISFHFIEVNGINTTTIDYIYLVNKHDLLQLLAFCIEFWAGQHVKFVYYKEHKRVANYVNKYFTELGFTVLEQTRDDAWARPWISTNGFAENEILEAFTS